MSNTIRERLLKSAEPAIQKPYSAAVSVRDTFFFQLQDRGMQKESERARQFGQLFDHFAPKRQPPLFSAFIPRIASTKGDLPVYSAESTLGYTVK